MRAVRANPACKNQPQLRGGQQVRLCRQNHGMPKPKQGHLDAESMWRTNQHIYFACVFNPFVRDLARGTLPQVDFEEYLRQDVHYLQAFSDALNTVYCLLATEGAMNMPNGLDAETRVLAIRKSALLLESVERELGTLHFTRVKAAHQEMHLRECWATESYINFLSDVEKDPQNSVPDILSSLLPCFRLYAELAVHLRQTALGKLNDPRQHPYADWILQYSSQEFLDTVKRAEWLFNKCSRACEHGRRDRWSYFYRTAMESELTFFGSHAPSISDENAREGLGVLLVHIENGCTAWNDDRLGGIVFAPRVVETLRCARQHGVSTVILSADWSPESIKHALERQALPAQVGAHLTSDDLSGTAKLHVFRDMNEALKNTHAKSLLSLGQQKSIYVGSRRRISMLTKASIGIIIGPSQPQGTGTHQRGVQIKPLVDLLYDLGSSVDEHVVYQANSWDEIFGILSASTWDPLKEENRARESRTHIPRVLLISGSDSGGGAGLQADIKTCASSGVFATNAVTAITAQNTAGVHTVHTLSGELVRQQIRAIYRDIGTSSIKIGMLGSAENVRVVSEELRDMNGEHLIVVDPVLSSSSGASLAEGGLVDALKEELFPLASVITPNAAEASMLLGNMRVESLEEMRVAAEKLHEFGPDFVLVKGGHVINEGRDSIRMAVDVLFDGENHVEFSRKYINDATNVHGTGCTLASAIASRIAQGYCMVDAIDGAKEFVWRTIERSHGLPLGTGSQKPMNHLHESFDWGADSASSGRRSPNHIDLSLYAVSSPSTTSSEKTDEEVLDIIRSVVAGGVSVIQIRDKVSEGGRLSRLVSKMVRFCRPLGVKVIVNDRVDVCIAADACGVHVGQGDIPAHIVRKMIGPEKILGVSCKTVALGLKAQRDGADYLGCGAVYDTPTKESRRIGIEGVSKIKSSVSIPVVAIGGLDENNIEKTLKESGCDGVAVVRAIFDARDVQSSTTNLRDIVNRTKIKNVPSN